MLVVMKAQATAEQIQAVCEHIEALGYRAHPMPGAQRTAIGITGNQGEVDRGGAYKPRTSPYAFQGLGVDALKIMAEIRDRFGLRIITEAIDNETLELVAEWADVVQIGARNMQNFSLLKHAGRLRMPVLLK